MQPGSDQSFTSAVPAPVTRLKRAFHAVAQLAEASSLSAFSQAGDDVQELRSWLSTCGTDASVAFKVLNETDAWQKLCSVLGKGWQLLLEQLRLAAAGLTVPASAPVRLQDEVLSGYAAVQAVQGLCFALFKTISAPQAQQIAASGLLQTLASTSDTLAEALDQHRLKLQQSRNTGSQHQLKGVLKKGFLTARSAPPPLPQQQQQQQQQQESASQLLDSAYFALLANLAKDISWLHLALASWPSEHLSGSTYARTILPAAKLAAAVVQLQSSSGSCSNCATSRNSSSSSSRSCGSGSGNDTSNGSGSGNGSDTGSGSGSGAAVEALDEALDKLIAVAGMYILATATELPCAPGMQLSAFGTQCKVVDETTLQILRSSEYLQLLLLSMCSMTYNLHQQNDGRSYLPASGSQICGFWVERQQRQQQQQQQQLIVPAYHEQCFSVLGLERSTWQRLPFKVFKAMRIVHDIVAGHVIAVAAVLTYQKYLGGSGLQQRPVWSTKLMLQLLHLLMELLLLAPDTAGSLAVPNALKLMVDFVPLLGQGPQSGANRSPEQLVAAMRAAEGPTAVTDLLSRVIRYVVPAGLRFIRQQDKLASAVADKAGADAAVSVDKVAGLAAGELRTLLLQCAVMAAFDTKDNTAQLISVFQKQPLRTLEALEAIVRSLRSSWIADKAEETAAAAATTKPQQAEAADAIMELMYQGMSPASALSSLPDMPVPLASEVLQPLPYAFSMTISTFKCFRALHTSRLIYSASAVTSAPWMMLVMSANCLSEPEHAYNAQLQLLQTVSNNSAHGDHKGVNGLVPWIVMVGRGLSLVGLQLQGLAALSAQYVAQDSMLTYNTVMQVLEALDATRKGLHHLQQQLGRLDQAGCVGTAAVSAAELAKLRRRAAALEELVTEAHQSFESQYEPVAVDNLPMVEVLLMMSADDPNEACKAVKTRALHRDLLSEADAVVMLTAAIGIQLPEDMIDLGNAVCGAFPLPYCCNHPGCTEFNHLSELESVGGKTAVCSRCMVARYCSKECQVAHWKHHKHACKAIEQNK